MTQSPLKKTPSNSGKRVDSFGSQIVLGSKRSRFIVTGNEIMFENFPPIITTYNYRSNIAKNESAPRFRHSTVNTGKCLWVFGGCNADQMKATIEVFDQITCRWSKVKAPLPLPRRYFHSAVYYEGKVYVFGGEDVEGKSSNLLFTLDEDGSYEFLSTSGDIPPPMKGHTALQYQGTMYIFGGIAQERLLNDLYEFDFKTKNWTKTDQQGTLPSPRAFHSTCIHRGDLYCYGGCDSDGQDLNDFYQFKPTKNTWTKLPNKGDFVPPGKHGHTLVSVRGDSEILMFGGDQTAIYLEIFKYSLRDQTWHLVNYEGDPGVPRKWHTATNDGNRIFIFGGLGEKSSIIDAIEIQISHLPQPPAGTSEDPSTMAVQDMIDLSYRSDWEAMAMKNKPEVLALRERLRGVMHEESYSVASNAARTEDPLKLSFKVMAPLIMDFLRDQGFKKTLTAYLEATFTNEVQQENALPVLMDLALRLVGDKDLFSPELKLFKWPWESSPDPEVRLTDRTQEYRPRIDSESDNIWKDEGTTIIRKNGKIAEGSLNAFVMHFIHRGSKDFKRCFLWCHHNFSSSQVVFQKLVEGFDVPSEADEADVKRIQKSVVNSLRFWLQECPTDFERDGLSRAIHKFLDYDLSRDTKYAAYLRELRAALKKCEKTLGKRNAMRFSYQKTQPPPEPQVPRQLMFSPDLKLENVPEVEVARQLTLQAHHHMCLVAMSELASGAWEKSPVEAEERCPNVVRLENWLQRTILWVREEVKSATERRARAKRLGSFAILCESLYELNNYQTLAAILQGLLLEAKQPGSKEIPSVYDKDWAKAALGEEQLRFINETAIPTIFGQRPKYHIKPCVPYMQDFLNTVTKLTKTESNFVEDTTMINFNKSLKLSLPLKQFKEFQGTTYTLLPVHQVQVFFDTFPKLTPKK